MSDFFLYRPGKRPEFWTTEEWAYATVSADWERRKERVARDYAYAKRQVWREEFEAACAQRERELREAWHARIIPNMQEAAA